MPSFSRFILVIVVSLVSLALAQTDERTLELLEKLEHNERASIDTVSMTVSFRGYVGFLATETKQHVVIDRENHRLYIETYCNEMLSERLVYNQGKASIEATNEDGIKILSAEQSRQLYEHFEAYLSGTYLYGIDETAVTYNGVKHYADLVEGEQITVEVTKPTFVAQPGELLGLIFDEEMLTASILTIPDSGFILTVMKKYHRLSDSFFLVDADVYEYTPEDDQAVLRNKIRFTNIEFNQLVEDSLFALETPIRSWLH